MRHCGTHCDVFGELDLILLLLLGFVVLIFSASDITVKKKMDPCIIAFDSDVNWVVALV